MYIEGEKGYRIISVNYPAANHSISFQTNNSSASVTITQDNEFELKIDEQSFSSKPVIKKASSLWNIFRSDERFISSVYYNNEKLGYCLRNIFLLRNDVSKRKSGERVKRDER